MTRIILSQPGNEPGGFVVEESMNINDITLDQSTITVVPGFTSLATTQTQYDAQRAKADPEFAAYRETPAWWIDKGLHASAHRSGHDVGLTVSQYFATREEAEAFAAQFPKGNKVKVSTLSGGYGAEPYQIYSIEVRFSFASNGVTGDRNESAIKRFRSFEKNAEKAGLVFDWVYPYSNSISHDEVQAHIA